MEDIYIDTVGFLMSFDIEGLDDISQVKEAILYIKKPSGLIVNKPMTTIDNELAYVTVDGDLNEEGTYYMQVYIILKDDRYKGYASKVSMQVKGALK